MTWLNLGEIVNVNAYKYPNKLALKDARRQLTFEELNERTNKLANGILKNGIKKGDKIAILSNNSIEFMEIYVAAAKGGFIIVPLNFRLHPDDISFIINNSDAKWLFVESRFREATEKIWLRAKELGFENVERVLIDDEPAKSWKFFEDIVEMGENSYPLIKIKPEDTWIILYTSGTTGKPKGVIRSHRSYIAFFLINGVEFSFTPQDYGMILMPLSHVNSTFYSFVFIYIGAPVYIHIEYNFDPEEILKIIDQEKITFTSMIPTHYNLILSLPEEVKQKYDLSSVTSLLTSSAPATKQMKLDVMNLFIKTKLFEAYGSTEAGLVTLLRPEDQMNKLGSIGKECIGTDCIKLLDEDGNPVPIGDIGELYSRGPQMFDEYYKLPEKTKDSFKGEFFSAGDMGKKDEEGFYTLVDRKANMLISGGEHVYPSEVEKVLVSHPSVIECAVIGLQDYKWGEKVTAVCILNKEIVPSDEITKELRQYCDDKLARFKIPKDVLYINSDEMPRTGSGKVIHRLLRERFNKQINNE
ncbi:MAG: long-chain fatty acid--CoA ligase [Promethearchaeota archaeon Loki_b32]|nr:MAG: long-chain fatty acid--CoA ligase [Candidatus Lokiarchaeota archaeon Loki_b32]